MNIAVVGLGLIGGSICRALKNNTFHEIWGIDKNHDTIVKALNEKVIDKEINPEQLSEANLTILCLYPEGIVDFVKKHSDCFKVGSIVTDVCGIKEYVVNGCTEPLSARGVYFVGAHPMAGREFSGFDYSTPELFKNASYIITPTQNTPQLAVDLLSTLASCIGFGRVVISTPQEHDRVIAYTSQLAHVVSNAYVKSPQIDRFEGYSAGSFQDLTRVAYLNEEMWTSLFMCNKTALLSELDCIIAHLEEYRSAIGDGDYPHLKALLRDGRLLKEKSLEITARGKGKD